MAATPPHGSIPKPTQPPKQDRWLDTAEDISKESFQDAWERFSMAGSREGTAGVFRKPDSKVEEAYYNAVGWLADVGLSGVMLSDAALKYAIGAATELVPHQDSAKEKRLARDLYGMTEAFTGGGPAAAGKVSDFVDLATPAGKAAYEELSKWVPDPNQTNIFIPIRKKELTEQYDSLADNGFTPEEIYRREGVWRTPSGEWIEEIDDSGLSINPEARKFAAANQVGAEGRTSDVIRHKELFKRLPVLGEETTDLRTDKGATEWFKDKYTLGSYGGGRLTLRDGPKAEEVAVHELQHGVQNIFGQDSGANSAQLQHDIKAVYDNLPKEGKVFLNNLGSLYDEFVEVEQVRKLFDPKTGKFKDWVLSDFSEKEARQIVSNYDKTVDAKQKFILSEASKLGSLAQPLIKLHDISKIGNPAKVSEDTANRFHRMYLRNEGEWWSRQAQGRKDFSPEDRASVNPTTSIPSDLWTQAELRKILNRVQRESDKYFGVPDAFGSKYAGGGMVADIPAGSLPQDVADDIDIKASEGEYIIPAAVVRHIGLKTIERMVEKAKKELEELEENGRIGGEPDDDSDDIMMAAGGLVQDNFTGLKTFVNKSGQTIYIPFMQGQPFTQVPPGFTEQVGKTPGAAKPTPGEDDKSREPEKLTGLAKTPEEWTPEEFSKYGATRGSFDEQFATNLIGKAVPMAKLGVQHRQSYLNKKVPELLDKMVTSGVDLQGRPITPEVMEELKVAAEAVKKPLKTGFSNPLKGVVADVVKEAFGLNKDEEEEQKFDSREGTAGSSTGMSKSDTGRDLEKGVSQSGTKTGGFFRRGGLVTKKPVKMAKGGLVTKKPQC